MVNYGKLLQTPHCGYLNITKINVPKIHQDLEKVRKFLSALHVIAFISTDIKGIKNQKWSK